MEHHRSGPGGPPPHLFSREIVNRLFVFLVVAFFSLVLRMNKQWAEAQQQKKASELSSLKAQINPHFLFNTLNSIYSLAITKSDETPAAIVKLSGMMRYVISEASAEYVELQKEITYISDYIHLQRLRLGDTVKISYETQGDPGRKKVVPLLIIPFVENAFKHGVNPEEDSEIRIVITTGAEEIAVFIRNNKLKEKVQGSTGLGNETTINRLKLSYPDRHRLQIVDNDDYFSVNLIIRLK
jgi:LytS/YehU family sensor histidine kinase